MIDAVVAAATPPGPSALAVVRITGDDAAAVFGAVARLATPGPWKPGRVRRVALIDDGTVYDDGIAVWFRGPRSATGQDLVEITCHGNDRIVRRLLACAQRAGARAAEPGEFTRRALVHGKVDLLGAEAVLHIAQAHSDAGIDVARAGVDGRLASAIAGWRTALVRAAADLEARLDWPDDELATDSDAAIARSLADAATGMRALADTCDAGRVLVHGARVALVGPVNAGKSSLFNALLGRPRALVHDTPGTTRDVLEVPLDLDGVHVTLLDTAGERATDDPVEAAGLALARELVAEADLLVVVCRAREGGGSDAVEAAILARTATTRRLVVVNGVDRLPGGPPAPPVVPGVIATSARTGEGLTTLRAAIHDALVGRPTASETLRIASTRQRDALLAAAAATDEAVEQLPIAGVAVAADATHRALAALDDLTGQRATDDVLASLFARFCIGK